MWPLPTTAILITVLLFVLFRPAKERVDFVIIIMAFSMLGLVSGYLTAFSRAPAVGAVLPAVLSLIGGLAVFLVGKEDVNRRMVGLSVLVFSTCLLLGTGWGGVMRIVSEEYSKSEIYLKRQAFIEAQVKDFRQVLELQQDNLGANSKNK